MKLVTAEEIRSIVRGGDDDPVSEAIRAVNKRIRERHGAGHRDALIGFTGGTLCFAKLAEGDRKTIRDGLSMGGFIVMDGPAPKTLKVAWGEIPDER